MADAYPTPYTALADMTQWEDFFSPLHPAGVLPGVGGEVAASLDATNRTVDLSDGAVWIGGSNRPVDATETATITAAEAQDRIDRCVMRLDRNALDAASYVRPVVIAGSPGASPQPPSIVRNASVYDVSICRFTAKANGSLTGFVDEREYAHGKCLSTARPAVPYAGEVRYETDTGRTVQWNGSVWKVIHEVAGPVTLTLAGEWTQQPNPLQVFKRDGSVDLSGSIRRTNVSFLAGDEVTLATIPVGYRPRKGYDDNTISFSGGDRLIVSVFTDGTVKLRSIDRIPADTVIRFASNWLID